jgi:hypothetical protein
MQFFFRMYTGNGSYQHTELSHTSPDGGYGELSG